MPEPLSNYLFNEAPSGYSRTAPLIYCFGRRVGFICSASRFEVRRFPFEASAQASDRERVDGEWLWELRWVGGSELARGNARDATEAAMFINETAWMHLRELRTWFRELDAADNREAVREQGTSIDLRDFVK